MNTSHATVTENVINEDAPSFPAPSAEENCRLVFQRLRFQTDLVADKSTLLGNASPTFKELMAHHVMQAKFRAMAALPSYDLRRMFKRMGIQTA